MRVRQIDCCRRVDLRLGHIRRGQNGAGDDDSLGGERARVAGHVIAGRVQHDLFGERADGSGVKRDLRRGVGPTSKPAVGVAKTAKGVEAAVRKREVAAYVEISAQSVFERSGGRVQHLQTGGQCARVLLHRAEVERVNVIAVYRRQTACAVDLFDGGGRIV